MSTFLRIVGSFLLILTLIGTIVTWVLAGFWYALYACLTGSAISFVPLVLADVRDRLERVEYRLGQLKTSRRSEQQVDTRSMFSSQEKEVSPSERLFDPIEE